MGTGSSYVPPAQGRGRLRHVAAMVVSDLRANEKGDETIPRPYVSEVGDGGGRRKSLIGALSSKLELRSADDPGQPDPIATHTISTTTTSRVSGTLQQERRLAAQRAKTKMRRETLRKALLGQVMSKAMPEAGPSPVASPTSAAQMAAPASDAGVSSSGTSPVVVVDSPHPAVPAAKASVNPSAAV